MRECGRHKDQKCGQQKKPAKKPDYDNCAANHQEWKNRLGVGAGGGTGQASYYVASGLGNGKSLEALLGRFTFDNGKCDSAHLSL
jgi:hypothetical protein